MKIFFENNLCKFLDPFERRLYNNSTQSTRKTKRDFQPIRVQFDTHLLNALVATYPDHVSYINNVLLPSLRTFWSETLSIVPASEIEVPIDGQCATDVQKLTGYGLDDFLTFGTSEISGGFVFVRLLSRFESIFFRFAFQFTDTARPPRRFL